MVFGLVPTSVTLNDLERCNSHYSLALQAYYFTVVEDRPILSAEYLPLLAKTNPPAARSLCDR